MSDKSSILTAVAALALGALAACGQTGKLYLPDKAGDVVTSPTATQPPAEDSASPNSPQTVDSTPSAPAPAPEVTAPAGTPEAAEEAKKEKGATSPPPK